MTAVEVVEKVWSSGGGDKLDDILRWPAKRVEGIYKAIIKREAVESIEQQRRDMIAAAYTNPNWDGKENSEKRKDYIKDLNQHFDEAIARIYDPDRKREPEVDWKNPFYAAHRREIARTKELFEQATGKTMGEVVEDEQSSNGREREFDQEMIPRNQ